MIRTRNHIARVHRVLVLNETEAIHELNLGDLAGAMGVEVVLNIGLSSYIHMVQLALPCQDPAPAAGTSQKTDPAVLPSARKRGQHTCTRQVTKVEPGRAHGLRGSLRHVRLVDAGKCQDARLNRSRAEAGIAAAASEIEVSPSG